VDLENHKMFKSIFRSVTEFVESISLFQKSVSKEESNVVKYEASKDIDEPIIENEPVKVVEQEKVTAEEEPIKKPEEPIEKIEEAIKEPEEIIEKVEDFVKDQTTVEEFVKEQEYDSDDEIVIHKQIYRTFTVKAPYNGPPQIALSENEQLVKVYENGQYVAARLNSIEDYGTDDDEESQFKVIYNIVVEA
jgi:hypothetical protein